jgi:hypothetical protein
MSRACDADVPDMGAGHIDDDLVERFLEVEGGCMKSSAEAKNNCPSTM